MKSVEQRVLVAAAAVVTGLYAVVLSLWYYPTGGKERRGLPVVALHRYPDLRLEMDGKPVPGQDPARDPRFARLQASRKDQDQVLQRLRDKGLLSTRVPTFYGLDPVIPSVGGTATGYIAHGRTFSRRQKAQWEGFRSQDVAVLFPSDGPRAGSWTREEHWAKASWEKRDAKGDSSTAFLANDADGMGWLRRRWYEWRPGRPKAESARTETVLNVSTMTRGLDANLPERDRTQSLEAVLLDMWSPLPNAMERAFRLDLFAAVVIWMLSAGFALVSGMCTGRSPRVLLLSTVGALIFGPFWFGLAWVGARLSGLLSGRRGTGQAHG